MDSVCLDEEADLLPVFFSGCLSERPTLRFVRALAQVLYKIGFDTTDHVYCPGNNLKVMDYAVLRRESCAVKCDPFGPTCEHGQDGSECYCEGALGLDLTPQLVGECLCDPDAPSFGHAL